MKKLVILYAPFIIIIFWGYINVTMEASHTSCQSVIILSSLMRRLAKFIPAVGVKCPWGAYGASVNLPRLKINSFLDSGF